MSFNYQVILRPKDVKFSVKEIPSKFDDGRTLKDVYDDILSGKTLCKDIPAAEVVWDSERWEWYTLSNRRLWVFKELEKNNKITFVNMSRVELIEKNDLIAPTSLHCNVEVYDPHWDISICEESDDIKKKIMSTELALSTSKKSKNSVETLAVSSDDEDEIWVEKSDVITTTTTKTERNVCSIVHKVKDLSKIELNKFQYRSNQSLVSNASCSSITRSERIIDDLSGLSGYGNYNTYKTEYLDKIKSGRKCLLEKYKPYNVNSSGRLSRSLSRSCEFSELSQRRVSLSSNTSQTSRNDNRSDVMSRLVKRTHRLRLFSDDIGSNCSSSMQDFNESSLVSYKRSSSTSELSNCHGIKLADLYAMWQKRRMQYIHSSRYGKKKYGSANGYLCGLCFKNFRRIVDLQQHSEALLHYACITCGKFFSSYASLGQHCERFRHKKD